MTRAVRIACLHTAASNVAVFEAAERPAEVRLRHEVREDLLQAAEAAGGLTEALRDETAAALQGLAGEADAVLLTCSTVGPGAAEAAPRVPVPVLRVDRALAESALSAAEGGGRLLVLCAVETTIAPTTALFREVAGERAIAMEVELVPNAWDAFRAGDLAGYHRILAEAADRASEAGAEVIAFAQASMAPAAALCRLARPLTSPAAGLAAAVVASGT